MRGYIQIVRPASAAIAAVLAMSSTYSFAQEAPAAEVPAADVPAAEVTVPLPVTAAPAAAPTFAPAQPIVQQTPSVEERLDAAVAASEAEGAARGESGAVPAQPRAARTAEPGPVPMASARATAPRPAPAEVSAPVAAPAERTVDPVPAVPAVAESPAKPAPASMTDPALYLVMGGGALVLLGLGGAAIARRRRATDEDQAQNFATAPAIERASPPAEHPPMPAPVVPVAPVPVMANIPVTDLDAMVAAPPSAENPFRTYKKRKVRAKFLLAQQRHQASQAESAQEPSRAPEPVLPRMETQTVYRFGSERGRQPGFKPQTR